LTEPEAIGPVFPLGVRLSFAVKPDPLIDAKRGKYYISVLSELEFDILQYIAAAVLLFFFRKMQEKPKFQESSRSEREVKANRPAKDRGSVRNVTFTGSNPGLLPPTSPSAVPITSPATTQIESQPPTDNVV